MGSVIQTNRRVPTSHQQTAGKQSFASPMGVDGGERVPCRGPVLIFHRLRQRIAAREQPSNHHPKKTIIQRIAAMEQPSNHHSQSLPPRSGHPPSARCGSFLEWLLMANLLSTDESCGGYRRRRLQHKPVFNRRKLGRLSSSQGVVIKQFSLSRSKGQTRGPTNKLVQTLTGFNSSAVIHD